MDPRLHDSQFLGMEVKEPKIEDDDPAILLSFKSEEGQRFHVLLEQTRALRCDNFRNGNIVFELIEVPAKDVFPDQIEHLTYINPTEMPDQMKRILDQLARGELKFVSLHCSYGAELMALCKGTKIVEDKIKNLS